MAREPCHWAWLCGASASRSLAGTAVRRWGPWQMRRAHHLQREIENFFWIPFEILWNSLESSKKKPLKKSSFSSFFSSPLRRGALWPLISFYAELQGSELLDAVHWRFVCEVSKSISKRKDKKYLTKILFITYVYICLHSIYAKHLCYLKATSMSFIRFDFFEVSKRPERGEEGTGHA